MLKKKRVTFVSDINNTWKIHVLILSIVWHVLIRKRFYGCKRCVKLDLFVKGNIHRCISVCSPKSFDIMYGNSFEFHFWQLFLRPAKSKRALQALIPSIVPPNFSASFMLTGNLRKKKSALHLTVVYPR